MTKLSWDTQFKIQRFIYSYFSCYINNNSIFVSGDKVQDIAIFDSATNTLNFNCQHCSQIVWKDGQVPIAQRILKLRIVTIPKIVFYSVVTCSIIGVMICCYFLYFNFRFRQVKSIKISSPRLNNIAAIGCIAVYIAVIFLGIDHSTFKLDDYYSKFCMVCIEILLTESKVLCFFFAYFR